MENIKSLQLSPSVLEELVQKHYVENKKIISLEGNLLRLAMNQNIPRNEFIKFYIGNEINPNLKKFLDTNSSWKQFFAKNKDQFYKDALNNLIDDESAVIRVPVTSQEAPIISRDPEASPNWSYVVVPLAVKLYILLESSLLPLPPSE